MIQRIQSVFMFLAAIAGVLYFFFPIAIFYSESGLFVRLFLYGVKYVGHDPFGGEPVRLFPFWLGIPATIIQIVIIILLIYTIFQYSDRLFQLRLNRLTIFLYVILIGAVFFTSTYIENKLQTEPVYTLSNILPIISIILIFVSNHFIRRDEQLVRSADRLR